MINTHTHTHTHIDTHTHTLDSFGGVCARVLLATIILMFLMNKKLALYLALLSLLIRRLP